MVSIPDKAKKVFEGEIFDLYQWEQEMFDGSTATFEMLKRPDTAQVIPVMDDKILIAEQENPFYGKFYSTFGGRVDQEADHLRAAKRELLEESGVVSDDWELWKAYEPYSKMDWTVYQYIARDCKQSAEQNLDPGEKIKVNKVSLDQFMEIVSSGEFRDKELVNDILQMRLDQEKLDEFKNKIFKNE